MTAALHHKPGCVSAPFCDCALERIAELEAKLAAVLHEVEDCGESMTGEACGRCRACLGVRGDAALLAKAAAESREKALLEAAGQAWIRRDNDSMITLGRVLFGARAAVTVGGGVKNSWCYTCGEPVAPGCGPEHDVRPPTAALAAGKETP